MDELTVVDKYYKTFMGDLNKWLPDGLIQVDINVLKELQLLDFQLSTTEPTFTRYFNVLESDDKITLINEQYIVWIIPEKKEAENYTYVFIALNDQEVPHMELAFSVSGVYNTSRLVLRLLERYLMDIQENEESIKILRR